MSWYVQMLQPVVSICQGYRQSSMQKCPEQGRSKKNNEITAGEGGPAVLLFAVFASWFDSTDMTSSMLYVSLRL